MTELKIIPGRRYDIFALEEGEVCYVLDFLSIIKTYNFKIFSKLVKVLDRTADVGLIKNVEIFRPSDKEIHLFAVDKIRLLCFIAPKSTLVLTNGFTDKSVADDEMQKALSLKNKYRLAKCNGYLNYREEIL